MAGGGHSRNEDQYLDKDGLGEVSALAVRALLDSGKLLKIHEKVFTELASTYTISNLDGNNDKIYIIIVKNKNGYSGYSGIGIRPNNDTGANYGVQWLHANSTTVNANRTVGSTAFWFGHAYALDKYFYTIGILSVKSGKPRIMTSFEAADDAGLGLPLDLWMLTQYWNNTVDNVTSLQFYSDGANGIGIGAEIYLFALRN